MKKLISIIELVLLAIMLFTTPSIASTKYDNIVSDPGWKKIIKTIDTQVPKILSDYVNLLVNKNDLNRLIKSGELDKEKSKFVAENSNDFLKYLHFLIIAHQVKDIKPAPTDAQFMYITGVIKDPRAQAAKTGPQYEQEKAFFRGSALYSLWESWRADGFLAKLINEQIDVVYAEANKKKRK